jgi:hypothetical protein
MLKGEATFQLNLASFQAVRAKLPMKVDQIFIDFAPDPNPPGLKVGGAENPRRRRSVKSVDNSLENRDRLWIRRKTPA